MNQISVNEIKSNIGIATTIQIFFITFVIIMKEFGTEAGIFAITYRNVLSYTLTIVFYLASFGLLLFIDKHLDFLKKRLRIINVLIGINVVSLSLLIFSFVGTLRYESFLLTFFNIIFSISLIVVVLSPMVIFTIILWTFFSEKKNDIS